MSDPVDSDPDVTPPESSGSPSIDDGSAGVDDSPADVDGSSTNDDDSSLRERFTTLGIAAGLGFGAVILTVALLLPVFVLAPRLGISMPTSQLGRTSLELFFGQVLAMGGLSVLYLHLTGRGRSYVPIRRPTIVESLIIIAAPFGIIFVTAMITQLSLLIGVEPSQHALGQMAGVDPRFYLYMVPLVIFIVGPFEELLYRGIVQRRLRESFGPPAAILLASVIFALIHIPAHGFGNAGIASTAASMTALVGGSVVFGAIYEWTENLTVVALIHGLYNSILLVLLYIVTVYGPEIEELATEVETAIVLVGL